MGTLCLTMIVRDEAHVIRRCLESMIPFIDTWSIVDTGSVDGTQAIIRDTLQGLPGQLHERPWKNFGHNRSEAIELARAHADYLFFIDADEILRCEPGFKWPSLNADRYMIFKERGGRRYRLPSLVRSACNWRFVGVLHEYLDCTHDFSQEFLDGLYIDSPREGARSRSAQTYRRDALILEQGLLDEPDNARYVFYLAQSYRDADDFDLAIRHYGRRVAMGGWYEEVFESQLQIARCKQLRGDAWSEVLYAYLQAHRQNAKRAEPLFAIGMRFLAERDWANARLFLKQASELRRPLRDILFVHEEIYEWLALFNYAVALYNLGERDQAAAISRQLLEQGKLTGDAMEQARLMT